MESDVRRPNVIRITHLVDSIRRFVGLSLTFLNI